MSLKQASFNGETVCMMVRCPVVVADQIRQYAHNEGKSISLLLNEMISEFLLRAGVRRSTDGDDAIEQQLQLQQEIQRARGNS